LPPRNPTIANAEPKPKKSKASNANFYFTNNSELMGYLFIENFTDIDGDMRNFDLTEGQKKFVPNKYNLQSRIMKNLKEKKRIRVYELPNLLQMTDIDIEDKFFKSVITSLVDMEYIKVEDNDLLVYV
jgi:hypothetical protein